MPVARIERYRIWQAIPSPNVLKSEEAVHWPHRRTATNKDVQITSNKPSSESCKGQLSSRSWARKGYPVQPKLCSTHGTSGQLATKPLRVCLATCTKNPRQSEAPKGLDPCLPKVLGQLPLIGLYPIHAQTQHVVTGGAWRKSVASLG